MNNDTKLDLHNDPVFNELDLENICDVKNDLKTMEPMNSSITRLKVEAYDIEENSESYHTSTMDIKSKLPKGKSMDIDEFRSLTPEGTESELSKCFDREIWENYSEQALNNGESFKTEILKNMD